jgi:6-pyruvoyltetrahydropterin/6-carboxytetrahydropterin synthase
MFELGITTNFSAAHHLVAYPGACAVLHGHNWQIDVYVRGEELDELGMLLDFKMLKTSVHELLEELDHTDLNTHPEFKDVNPTSEYIAQFIYRRLAATVVGDRFSIARVTVHETPGATCSYWE